MYEGVVREMKSGWVLGLVYRSMGGMTACSSVQQRAAACSSVQQRANVDVNKPHKPYLIVGVRETFHEQVASGRGAPTGRGGSLHVLCAIAVIVAARPAAIPAPIPIAISVRAAVDSVKVKVSTRLGGGRFRLRLEPKGDVGRERDEMGA